jgi:hypothetical protein
VELLVFTKAVAIMGMISRTRDTTPEINHD